MIPKIIGTNLKSVISVIASASLITGQMVSSLPAISAETNSSKYLVSTDIVSDNEDITADPILSMDKMIIPASAAGSNVNINIYINDERMGESYYYYKPYVRIDIDGRLGFNGVKNDMQVEKNTFSIRTSNVLDSAYRKSVLMSSNYGSGCNGIFATMEFSVPEYAQPGDIFYFDIHDTSTSKTSIEILNSGANAVGNSRINPRTADNSSDKYLNDTQYDGYILIDPDSVSNVSCSAKPYNKVSKDHVTYAVYEDHSEIAYCDYGIDKVNLLSDVNGQEVTAIADYAFAETDIKSVYIPDSVKNIGERAFENCRALAEIRLPDLIEYIPGYMCSSCTSLNDIKFPSSVTNIGDNAFFGTGITELKIPDSVRQIGNKAFMSCNNLESVKLSSHLEELCNSVFDGCKSLKSLELPDSLIKIGNNVFADCDIKEIIIPGSVKEVGASTFNKSNIVSIIYSDEIETLPDNAFGGASKIKSIKLPSKLKAIPYAAFIGCTSLAGIDIPETVTSIGGMAFYKCGLTKFEIPDSIETFEGWAFAGSNIESIEIPDRFTELPDCLFMDSAVKEVKLPLNLKALPDNMFEGCQNLTNIEIPDSVTSLGSSIFSKTGIKEIRMPVTIKSIAYDTFNGSYIESIIYPDTLTELPTGAFRNAGNLKSAILPSSIKTIPDNCFRNCYSLKEIEIPDTVISIGYDAFRGCGVKTLVLPDTIETINEGAFSESGLVSVKLPARLKSISEHAFSYSSNLVSIKLNEGLETINRAAFQNCTSLSDIEIPDTVTSVNYEAFEGTAIKSIVIPESVTKINTNGLFKNCIELETVTLPDTVKTISSYAFQNCVKLKGVDIPDSVYNIQEDAFSGTTFTSLYIPARTKVIDTNAFRASNIDTIYGYIGSEAERFAKEKNLSFIECETKIWNNPNILPDGGVYKLACDVTVNGRISVISMLDLDLNGHKVIVNNIRNSGNLVIRDSSVNKTGVLKQGGDPDELITVTSINCKLSLLGGNIIGNEKGYNPATIDIDSSNCLFNLDGATVISYSGYPLLVKDGYGTLNLISGKIEAQNRNSKGPYPAVYIHNYKENINITGAEIKAINANAIHSDSSSSDFNISGGKISSLGGYGLRYHPKNIVNISGDINITGDNGGIYVPENTQVNIIGKITLVNLSIFAEASGRITNGLKNYIDSTEVSKCLSSISSNGTLLIDDDGEIRIEISGEENTTITTSTTASSTTTSTTTTTSTSTSTTTANYSTTTTMTTSTTTTSTETTTTTTTANYSTTTTTTTTYINTKQSTTTTTANSTTTTITKKGTENNDTIPPSPQVIDVDGVMKVKEMNLDQIERAGINLSNPSNYHVYEYEIKMEFGASVVSITKYDAEPIHGGGDIDYKFKDIIKKPTVKTNGKGSTLLSYRETKEEEMYLIVTGENKWLKEFFDVELIVINKSTNKKSTLSGCSASLNVPEGLSLVNCQKDHYIGSLDANQSCDFHWYVRGDEAGIYSLSSEFKGKNKGEEFKYTFETVNPIHVYSSDALKMKIILPKYSFFDEDYPVTISFENVSDKPIYNIEHTIKGFQQYSKLNKYKNHELVESKTDSLQNVNFNGETFSISQLDPGDEIVAEITIHDIWKSILEENIDNQKIAADLIAFITGLFKNPVFKGVSFIASIYRAVLEGIVASHVLKCVDVATLKNSTTKIPYEVIITDISPELNEKYAKSILSEVTKCLIGESIGMVGGLRTYNDVVLIDPNIVKGTDIANNTYNLIKDQNKPGNSNDDHLYNWAQYAGSFIPGGRASKVLTLGRDVYYRFRKPSGGSSVMFYVVKSNGTIMYAPNFEIDYNKRAAYNDFDIEIVEGEYTVNKDGSIMLNSDAIIRVIPKKANINATIGAKTLDGEEIVEFPVNVVDDHECKGEYMIISQPSEDEGAIMASFCNICYELIECTFLPKEATAMLSNGHSYQDIRGALADAAKSEEELKLYIFGNVNISESLTIPDNITLIIVPETKITLNDNCQFIAKGEVKDFSGFEYNLSGNGPIVQMTISTTTVTSTSTTTSTRATTASTTSTKVSTTGTISLKATTTSATSTSAATTSTASTSATTTSTTTTSAATTSAITTSATSATTTSTTTTSTTTTSATSTSAATTSTASTSATTTSTTTTSAATTSAITTSATSTSATATSATTTSTTTTSTTTTSAATTSTTTSAAVNNITSDEDLAMWAIVDYQQRNMTKVEDVEIKNTADGLLEIILKDNTGKVLDTYTIDPKTGEGTNSSNEVINLPQTGNNSATNILIALVALMMIGLGMIAIKMSGVRSSRKKQ